MAKSSKTDELQGGELLPKVKIGDTVIYSGKSGELRPAIVVAAYDGGTVDLHVFFDPAIDLGGAADFVSAYFRRSIKEDNSKSPNTFHRK